MGAPPNCVQDHSKSLNPCRSWGADPLECLRRSLLAPPPKKNNDPWLRHCIITDHNVLYSNTVHMYANQNLVRFLHETIEQNSLRR